MADPKRQQQGPILPPHMLGKAPDFHVPAPAPEPRQPGRTIGGSDLLGALLLAAVNAGASGAVPGLPSNEPVARQAGERLRSEWDAFLRDPAMQEVLDPSISSVRATNPLTGEAETVANPLSPLMLFGSLFGNFANQGNRIGSEADIPLYDPGLTYQEVFENAGHPEDVARALAGLLGVVEPGPGELGQLARGLAAAGPAAAQVIEPMIRGIRDNLARRQAQKRLNRQLREMEASGPPHSGQYTTVTMDDGTTIEVPTDWLPPGFGQQASDEALGAVPFMRTLRDRPEIAERVTDAVGNPRGARGMFDDLIESFHGVVGPGGDELVIYGGRNIRPGEPNPISDAPPGTTSQMKLTLMGDDSIYVDLLVGSEAGGNAARDLLQPVLDFADAHGVTLYGSANGFTHRIDTEGLVGMYGKAGFEPAHGRPYQGERSFDMVRRPLSLDDAERNIEVQARLARSVARESPSGLRPEDTATLDDWMLSEGYSYGDIADRHEELAYEYAGRSWDEIRTSLMEDPRLLSYSPEQAFGDTEAFLDGLTDDIFALSRSRLAEGADGFVPLEPVTFPRTELGVPSVPSREALSDLAGRGGEEAVAEWMVALGVDAEQAAEVARAATFGDPDLLTQAVRDAYGGAFDPDTARQMLEVFDPPGPHSPLITPDPRLYRERELADLRPVDERQLRRVGETEASVRGGDDTWLGRPE